MASFVPVCFCTFCVFFFSLLTVLTIHIIANALSVLLPEDKHVIKRQLYSKPFTLWEAASLSFNTNTPSCLPRFNADTSAGMEWKFKPQQREIKVHCFVLPCSHIPYLIPRSATIDRTWSGNEIDEQGLTPWCIFPSPSPARWFQGKQPWRSTQLGTQPTDQWQEYLRTMWSPLRPASTSIRFSASVLRNRDWTPRKRWGRNKQSCEFTQPLAFPSACL